MLNYVALLEVWVMPHGYLAHFTLQKILWPEIFPPNVFSVEQKIRCHCSLISHLNLYSVLVLPLCSWEIQVMVSQLTYLTKISFFFLFSVDLKKGSCPSAAKSNLPKPCPSGLRPPGYSRLPAAKLAAFGFVRSSSVSSVSSNQSNDSAQSDQSRTTNRKSQKCPSFCRDIKQVCPRIVQTVVSI